MLRTTAALLLIVSFAFTGCSVLQKSSLQDIPEGRYLLPHNPAENNAKDSLQQKHTDKIYLYLENDSIFYLPYNNHNSAPAKLIYPLSDQQTKLVLFKPSFDFDIFTTPFKFRPAITGIPQQLNTNFNGSFYFGYRMDRYTLKKRQLYPGVVRENFNKTGIGIGAFVGAGSVFINPKFMNNAIDYEYDAFAIDYGAAALFGFRNFSTGLSLGFDLLTDKNRKHWVYQNKLWIGIFIGLNLN
ncbi:MAG: hypothetical protein ACOVP7_09335 [Lacibacter sp.]